MNPRFRDWRPMYLVARPALGRLTGRRRAELDGYFEELLPLHAALRAEAGALPTAGALMQAPLLYVLVRALGARRILETGISSGYSARLILEAIARNGAGHLDSIGVEVFGLSELPRSAPDGLKGRRVGWLVPERLRGPWSLHLGTSQEHLPALVAPGSEPIDLFLHDSLHQYPTMHWEFSTAFPALARGGLLASHDVHANRAWPDFLNANGLRGDEVLDHDLGVVRRPGPPS